MDQSASGFAPEEGQPEASGRVVLDVISHSGAAEGAPVTRRHALSGGAKALVAATVAGASLTGADGALASTTKKTKKKTPAPKKKGPLTINVNGTNRVVKSSPDSMLLYVLRNEFELHGPRFGCGLSECGACAVLLNGKQIRSCVTPVGGVPNDTITTVEGLPGLWAEQRGAKGKTKGTGKKKHVEGHDEFGLPVSAKLHPIQQAWIDQQVPQCGYCQSGMMIQAADLLSVHMRPTEAEIKTNMNGHLCRCGTYTAIIEAIQEAGKTMEKELA
jgi:isoquinoline 1-oxidoreductase subunit alpha